METVKRVLEIIGMQPVPSKELPILGGIYKTEHEAPFAITKAFLYGVICGKQQERKKRKGGDAR